MKDFVETNGKTQSEFCKIRLHMKKKTWVEERKIGIWIIPLVTCAINIF